MTFDYKKYSLENLEKWIEDAINSSEASPHEIYDVIKNVVSENYYCYKNHTERCYELLALLNGNGKCHIPAYDEYVKKKENLVCDKDDKSPECQKSWNDFWEENYYPEEVKDACMSPWGHSDIEYNLANPTLTKDRISNFPGEQYSEEELNSMCDKAASGAKKNWKIVNEDFPYPIHVSEDGDVWIPDSVTKEDKVVKWQLPIEVDGASGEYYIQFPDDLMEAANIKENDMVEWVDRGDGSYLLKKVNG
jgi:hypothetical protein